MFRPQALRPIVPPVVDTSKANLPVWQPPTVTVPVVQPPPAVPTVTAPPPIARQASPDYQNAMPDVNSTVAWKPPIVDDPSAQVAWTPPTVTAPVVNTAPTAPAPFDPRAQRADLSNMPSALTGPLPLAPVDPYTKAQQDYSDALNSKEHPSKLLSGLFLALQGISKTFNPNNNTPVQTLADARHDAKVKDAAEQLGAQQQLKAFNTTDRYRNAQAQNLEAQPGDREAAIQQRRDQQTLAEQGRNRRALFNQKIFDPKSVEGQAQMKAAGFTPEEMAAAQPHNYTNPRIQKVGPDTFEYDKMLGAWKQTGLPTDQAKQLNPYEVTEDDAQGNQHVVATYYLNDDQAARLQQQKALQGQRLNAAKEMQTQRIGAQAQAAGAARDFKKEMADFADKNGQAKAVQRATQSFTQTYMRLHKGKTPSPDEINGYLGTIFPQQ